MSTPLFNTVTIIGGGLIGSSIARAIQKTNSSSKIIIADKNQTVCERSLELNICSDATTDIGNAVSQSDLVYFCTPVGTFENIAAEISPHIKPNTIISDVGSVKKTAISAINKYIPDNVYFVPAHPIAGTENSGPDAGFSHLFENRWLIITPIADNKEYNQAKDKLTKLWTSFKANVTEMDAEHHDKVLAITSHLPHLIAYTIVSTASDLEHDLQDEVVKFSASGFRDFTRIASSDPTMWRDIFLTNKDAVLDIIQRFNDDLTHLQKAIKNDDGDALHNAFTRTRAIRKAVIEQGQAIPEEYKKPQLRKNTS